MKLAGKTALVTGASKGIGREIALKMAEAGADIIVNYFQDKEGAEAAAEDIRKAGRKVIVFGADVSSKDDVTNMVNASIKTFSKIDILVNNAGIAIWKPFFDIDESTWDKTIDTNLKGTFLCTQAVTRTMVKNKIKGTVINISSNAGYAALDCLVPYCASKGGITMITKAMAYELAPFNIRVNAVAPGPIEIERNLNDDPEFVEKWTPYIPLGRTGQVEEVSSPVLFFASDDSSYITGQVLYVEGGSLCYIPMPRADFARKT